ncbi:hypothetical protein TNCV_4612411 [Trichonephila clavipes]|nr:hypothetical protein TNCV_4612411 [Trichonephila clavipes]
MILCATHSSAFSILGRTQTSRIRLRLRQSSESSVHFESNPTILDSAKLKVFSGLTSTLSAQASHRPYAFADPRSLSHVPQMWTCVACQQFAGCLIDSRYAKLRTHNPRSLQFWLLLGVQNGVRRRPPPSLNALCHFPD